MRHVAQAVIEGTHKAVRDLLMNFFMAAFR